MSSYLTEFRNTVLALHGNPGDEKLDRFCTGLKPQVRLELLKCNSAKAYDAARIVSTVDSPLFGAGLNTSWANNRRALGALVHRTWRLATLRILKISNPHGL